MIDPDAALAFTGFVSERHRVWEQRQAGSPQPWTADPHLAVRKFCNVYRVLDYGSQFVLTDLIDPELDPRDQLMRLFLYRHTGQVPAWQYLSVTTGYPTRRNLDEVLAAWQQYRGKSKLITSGNSTLGGPSRKGRLFENRVFTPAYLVFPQSTVKGTDKLDSIIDLTRRLFIDADVGDDFYRASSQRERFATLRRNKGVADFMSMQILTDWGYTPHCGEDRENEFVIPGPGAVKGALALDPHGKPGDTLRWAVNAIWNSGGPLLGSRLPSYMDVQNCLCEFSKYVRFEGKPNSVKPYRPAHPGAQPAPVLPKHW